MPACESVLYDNVLPLGVTELAQPLPERVKFSRGSERAEEQKPDPGDLPHLLRLGVERRGEHAPTHHGDKRSAVDQGHVVDYRADPDTASVPSVSP